MGAVYAAFDEKLERDVALKILNDEGDAALQKKRLLREARLAAKLQHPNIATVYEVDELEGRLLIVMELLEGSSLRKILSQRKMSVDEAISIARDMARALARAHTANVIHRDIKPENVFVTTPSPDAILAKVLDFGLARQRPTVTPGMPAKEEATSTNTTSRGDMWGTPGYVSPEQAHGYPVDLRTDIFSFGIVFYEMLAGIKPFRGENPIAVMIATTKVEPRPLREITPDVPPEVVDIVAKCLKKEPDGRYKDGAALAAALETYVRGTTQSGKMTMNVVGSSPNLPQLSLDDVAGDDTVITTGDVLADDHAPTTGGPAIIEMTTSPEAGVPSLEQQRTDHMKLVAAIGGGVAMALVVVIIAVSWASPSSPSAKAKAAASASASARAAAAQLDLPPPPPPSEIVAPPDPATSMPEIDPPPTPSTTTPPVVHRKRPPGSKPADCADPFTKDAKGVRIPKLHCL